MISRKKFSIVVDESINKQNDFYEDFAIDFTVNHFNVNGKFNFQFLSLMNKVYCNIMQSTFFKNAIGDRYELVNFENKYLATHDKEYNTNSFYNIPIYSIVNCPKKLEKDVLKLNDAIDDILFNEDYPNLILRNKARHKYKEIVPIELNSLEKVYLDNFLKNFPEYNIFFKKKTIKETLEYKSDNELVVVKKDSFKDHLDDIRSMFPYKFYDEFKDLNEEFYKIKDFIRYDINLDYFFDDSKVIDKDIWFTFKINNEYKGGTHIHSDNYSTTISTLSIFNQNKNDTNMKKIFKFISQQDEVKSDLMFFDKSCFSEDISNKDIRRINKEKRIYFTKNEQDLFLDISFFIDNNNLEFQKEEILNKFYETVILDKQHLINSDAFSYREMDFNNKIKEEYLINAKPKEIKSREDFLNNLIFNHSPELLPKQLKKELTDLNFSFEEMDIKTKKSTSTKDLIVFLEKINIKIDEKARSLIFSNISSIGNFIDILEYQTDIYDSSENDNKNIFKINYNLLYDFLIDNSILPKGDIVKIYRLEDVKGKGIYTSENTVIKKNKILDYSDNKLPSKERALCQIFNPDIDQEYQDKFYFGFSDIKQLKKWTRSDTLELVNSDFKLFEYEVNENYLLKTSKQVAFIIEKSTSKKEIDLVQALDLKINKPNKNIKNKM